MLAVVIAPRDRAVAPILAAFAAVLLGALVVGRGEKVLSRLQMARDIELQRFRSLATATGQVITVFDAGGRYRELYGAARYDITLDDLRGLTPLEFLGDSGHLYHEAVQQAVHGRSGTVEWQLQYGDMDRRMETRLVPVDLGDEGCRVLGSTRDITEEHVRERLFSAVVMNSPSAIYVFGLDGRLIVVNELLASMLGEEESSLLGRHRADIPALAPDAVEHERNDQRVLAAGQAVTVEETFQGRSYISVKFPISDADGTPFAVGGISTDITALKDAQQELRDAWRDSLRRLAAAVEYRDEDTAAHVERMSLLCGRICLQMGFDGEYCARITEAAALHDAGKVAIPDHILLKPGRLTPEERAIMETHTTVGFSLLSGSGVPLLELAAQIALSHHERWDGTGYPNGLAGIDIPFEARVAAVADVYDALTSDRPYRQALDVESARNHLRDGRGRHFDPTIVDAFLETDHPEEKILWAVRS